MDCIKEENTRKGYMVASAIHYNNSTYYSLVFHMHNYSGHPLFLIGFDCEVE